MSEYIDLFMALPTHIKTLYAALLLAGVLLIFIMPDLIMMKIRSIFGLKKKPSRRNYSSSRSTSKKGTSFFKRGASRYQRSGNKSIYSKGGYSNGSSYSKKGSFFGKKQDSSASKMRSRSINGYDYSNANRPTTSTTLSSKLDFLSPQSECISSFKHGPVNSYYKEMLRPGPACDLRAPDIDELDETFTVMLKAGAVQKKNFLVTDFEHQYLQKLRMWFADRYEIYCQVSVGSSLGINPDVSDLPLQQRRTFAQKCHNMSFDFMLVERATDRITCVVELDDPTHLRGDRRARDRRLDKVCAAAHLPIFHITRLDQKPDLKGL